MISLQVIALGSPFGADRIAWSAIESLQEAGFDKRFPQAGVLLQHCSSPALLPAMVRPGARLVILDALLDAQEGEVRRLSLQDLEPDRRSAGSHGLDLAAVLPLIETLQGPDAGTVILGIGMGTSNTDTVSDITCARLMDELTAISGASSD